MKIQTHPVAGGVVAALYYLLAIIVALQLSCLSSARSGFARQVTAQMSHAVKVSVNCDGAPWGAGSGVLIGGRYVLTAAHVVACKKNMLINVSSALGPRPAFVDRLWLTRDIARLSLAGGSDDFIGAHRPTLAAVEERDVVCSAVRTPTASSSCGAVTAIYTPDCLNRDEPWCRTFTFDGEIARGNSGGGLYNARGQLVGLVTGASFVPGTSFWLQSSFATELWAIRNEVFE